MNVDRILNRTARVICLPPLTIWPKEARSVLRPGETASMMMIGDSPASPLRVYPAVVCPPGVTRDQEGNAPHGTAPRDIPRIPLTESHDAAYWDVVCVKADKYVKAGYIEFRSGAGLAEGEKQLQELTDKAREIDLKTLDDREAIEVVLDESRNETLLSWKVAETRPRVKKAIEARIRQLS